VAYFGDGATSEGDFHEACNFAGVLQLPVIFFCQNNGYAISVPFSKQSASKTIAERASAYSFEGIQVDGNDVLAVYKVMNDAIHKARAGKGPTLIEAVTFRTGSHTTADDATRYRQEQEVEKWSKRDPLRRYEHLLRKQDLWNDVQESEWDEECRKRINDGIGKAERTPSAPGTHLFEHVFHELPKCLQKQKNELAGEG
jgi:pyruvate dehydrogenase E1 component alpha subunit